MDDGPPPSLYNCCGVAPLHCVLEPCRSHVWPDTAAWRHDAISIAIAVVAVLVGIERLALLC
jgi:hypothetical protein